MITRGCKRSITAGMLVLMGCPALSWAQDPLGPVTIGANNVSVTDSRGVTATVPLRDTAASITWRAFHNQGWDALRAGRFDLADELFRASLTEAEKFPAGDVRLATSYHDLGWVFFLKDRPADAEPLAKWAFQAREAKLGPVHPEVGDSYILLAKIAKAQKRLDEAEQLARRAVAIYFKSNFGLEDRHPPYALDVLGEMLEARGELVKAEAVYVKSLNLRESALGISMDFPYISDEDVTMSYKRLAGVLRRMGRNEEAEALEQKAGGGGGDVGVLPDLGGDDPFGGP